MHTDQPDPDPRAKPPGVSFSFLRISNQFPKYEDPFFLFTQNLYEQVPWIPIEHKHKVFCFSTPSPYHLIFYVYIFIMQFVYFHHGTNYSTDRYAHHIGSGEIGAVVFGTHTHIHTPKYDVYVS